VRGRDIAKSRLFKIGGMAGLVTVVVVSAWLGLGRLERLARDDLGASLRSVVVTTREALREWLAVESEEIERIAGNPEVERLVQDLPRRPALQSLRDRIGSDREAEVTGF
jgi:hypothetical protein